MAETSNVTIAPEVLVAAAVTPSGMLRIGGSVCGRATIVIVPGPMGRGNPSGVSNAFTVRDHVPSVDVTPSGTETPARRLPLVPSMVSVKLNPPGPEKTRSLCFAPKVELVDRSIVSSDEKRKNWLGEIVRDDWAKAPVAMKSNATAAVKIRRVAERIGNSSLQVRTG